MALEVRAPLVPVHESVIVGLFSATVHETMSLVVHATVVVSPLLIRPGVTVMLPSPGGAGKQPPEQPHGQF